MISSRAFLLVPLTSLLACGPAAVPPATQPARRAPPASAPASRPATQPAPWVTERCRGVLLGPGSAPASGPATAPTAAAAVAAPLGAEEAAALKERGQLLEPARMRHLVVGRGGRIELHRKPAPDGRGNGGGKGNGNRNGVPGPGVACAPVAEADLLPLPGCERLHLCVADGAYALVVEAGGRPALARGATVGLAAFNLRVAPAPEAGEQIVWTVTEQGREPAHRVTRDEVLRPKGLRLRQVFGRPAASTAGGAAGTAGPASRPAECSVEPLVVRCGDERYPWDAAAFEYRLAPPPELQPYRPQELDPGAVDPVRTLYAALHAAARVGAALQRRGFECVEAQEAFELWSRWPVREGRAVGAAEVWRVAVAPRRVTAELLPFVAEDDGRPRVRGVPPDHAYPRERALLQALRAALERHVDGPPAGLEGFRCAAGYGQPIADAALGAALDKLRAREQRWRRRCDKTLDQARRAAAAAGGRVRLTCTAADKVVRTYDFDGGALAAVTERYPADVAERHLRRAAERWTARFGQPAQQTPTDSRWRWRDRELGATRLPDGAAVFGHRRLPAVSQPASPAARAPRSPAVGQRR